MTVKRRKMKGINQSGLAPLGRAVLVETYEPEIKSGSIVIPQTVSEKMMMREMRCVVVAVGPDAWKGESGPRAKVGDKVLVSNFAGAMVEGPWDGKMYRCVNANDIFLRIDAEYFTAVQVAA